MAECTGAGLSDPEHPCLSPYPPEQDDTGLAAMAAGELGQVELLPKCLRLYLCPENRSRGPLEQRAAVPRGRAPGSPRLAFCVSLGF